jgi:hypothetical protein
MERAEHLVVDARGGGHRSWLDEAVPQRPTSAPEALAALDAVTRALIARGDRRAAFPDIYAIITRRVVESVALGEAGLFWEPRWISRLAGRFCERYVATLRWSMAGAPQDTGAWSVAYACCELGDMRPLHHVILGLSAHINFDLALGIADTVREFGAAGDEARMSRYKHDHDAVNHLLRASVPEAFDHLGGRLDCDLSRVIYRHTYGAAEWLAMRVLSAWRERVWGDATELLAAPTAAAEQRVIRRMEARSRRYARLIALTSALPPPAGASRRRAEALLQAIGA